MLSKEFNIKSLCEYMNISRSGYYKWLKNKDKLNRYEIDRLEIEKLVKEIHTKKPSYGYRRINRIILRTTGWIISNNLVHKVCKCLKIKSKSKHYKYKKLGNESVKYKNLIKNNWTVNRPFEKIVSDTTRIYFKGKPYDWTFYLDVFNNEIIGSDVRECKYGVGRENHMTALEDMLRTKIERGYKNFDTILHTDQGSIYSSLPYNHNLEKFSIIRSMSRSGTPTDNPVIESMNGWLKKEISVDYDIDKYNTIQELIKDVIKDNNEYRPSYTLKYKTPIEYRTQLGFN